MCLTQEFFELPCYLSQYMNSNNINGAHEYHFLLNNAAEIRKKNLGEKYYHLDQSLGIKNYIRIADDIAKRLPSGAKVLDWGCGLGQMSYLLKNRNFDVVSYDIAKEGDHLPDIALCRSIQRIVSSDSTFLPFGNDSFDAVLSCGVLEHVDEMSSPGNEIKSLREINRLLKPGGRLLIYQLPQNLSWQEAIVRRFKLGYAHPRRYSAKDITNILNQQDFMVTHLARCNLIPKNLTGMPKFLREAWGKLGNLILVTDKLLSQIPLLNRIAGALELSARKKL
jgi:ubiquinone/menaquinone biosynthesis C-methylase UbiE